MTTNGLLQIFLYLVVLLLCARPLGSYMARIYENKPCGLDIFLRPVERLIYRLCGISTTQTMNWKSYSIAILAFSFFGILFLYLIQRWQNILPLNPANFSAIRPDLAFNTAISFITNTNWQAYAGENTISYFSQMFGLTVQNFISAACGMAILVAFIRGITSHGVDSLGNFWVDLVRGILYIMLPLAMILAVLLVSQGVVQTFKPNLQVDTLQTAVYHGTTIKEQIIPMGPVASQVAIKQLGTNGGGFYHANSAHPLENPTPFSNFLEMLALTLIPAAFCFTFGEMVKDKRQGIAIFIIMTILFMPMVFVTVNAEQHGNPAFNALGIEQNPHFSELLYATPGGNMEGKEMRFGITDSALYSVATTAASNGSVNSVLDSYTPIGGMIPMVLMQLGEVVYGGVGSGLYGILIFIILTVFIAGLMVGRTPEYLGKKIEVFEMKMACLAILIPHIVILVLTVISVGTNIGRSAIFNPGPHGFSEILYTFSSAANNNGSAFSGLNVNNVYYNTLTGVAMLLGRFWIILPVLAIAGSLARKKVVPVSQGTMQTHTTIFILLVISVIVIVGALSFFPALSLGPIIEQFKMTAL